MVQITTADVERAGRRVAETMADSFRSMCWPIVECRGCGEKTQVSGAGYCARCVIGIHPDGKACDSCHEERVVWRAPNARLESFLSKRLGDGQGVAQVTGDECRELLHEVYLCDPCMKEYYG